MATKKNVSKKRSARYDAVWRISDANGKASLFGSSEDFTSEEQATGWARKNCQSHLKPGQTGLIQVIKTPPLEVRPMKAGIIERLCIPEYTTKQ